MGKVSKNIKAKDLTKTFEFCCTCKREKNKNTHTRGFWIGVCQFDNLKFHPICSEPASLPALEETKEAEDSYSFQMSGRNKTRSPLRTEKHQYPRFPTLWNFVSLLHLKMVTSIHALWISPHLQHCICWNSKFPEFLIRVQQHRGHVTKAFCPSIRLSSGSNAKIWSHGISKIGRKKRDNKIKHGTLVI